MKGYRSIGTQLILSFRESSWPTRIFAACLSVIFAAATVIGSIAAKDQAGEFNISAGLLQTSVKTLLSSLVYFLLIVPVLHLASRARGLDGATYSGLWAMTPFPRRLIIGGVLAAPWFVYWVFLWPGVTTNDSYNQILQALGISSYSDHHPILQTLMIQELFRPFLSITGSVEVAIGSITLVQMLVMTSIVGLCIDALRQFKAPGWALTATLLFFALHPIIGWYSVTLWKDVWLGVLTLAVATITALIMQRARAQKPTSWYLWALLLVALFAMMASKKTALYIVLPTILAVALFLRRRELMKWLIVGLGSVVLFLAAYTGVMLALQVQPGSEVEAWSMPSQQIARVVKKHGDSLTEAQVQLTETFFPGADLGELYRPGVSDPVKKALDSSQLSANRETFLSLWFELGKEYPATYFEAFVDQTYGYWYPGVSYWVVSDQDWGTMVEWNAVTSERTKFLADQAPIHSLTPDHVKLAATEFVNVQMRDIPVIGWFLSLGAWTWATTLLGVIALLRRQSIATVVLLISGMVWLSAMFSPVFAEARYVYPMLLLLPLLGIVTFSQRENQSEKDLTSPEDEVPTSV